MSPAPVIVALDDFERVAEQFADWSRIRQRADVRIHQTPLRGAAPIEALRPADVVVPCATVRRCWRP